VKARKNRSQSLLSTEVDNYYKTLEYLNVVFYLEGENCLNELGTFIYLKNCPFI